MIRIFSLMHDPNSNRSANSIQSDLSNQEARRGRTLMSCQSCHMNRLIEAYTLLQM